MELCEDLLDARVDSERVTVDAPLESAKRGLRRMESCKRHIGRFSPEDRPHLEDFPPFSRATMFAMYTAEQVIETLRAHEAELRQAGLRSLSLFGSVVRGETEADSDIDLAAEFDPAARMDLLQLSALERRIAELV
jgi:predicted nucleotidyltransferase